MKYFFLFVLFIVAGYFAFQELKPKPVPPPPPPPPILSKINTIRPLLSPEDEQRIAKSADDTNEKVRWQALKLLANGKSSLALPLLFKHLEHDPSVPLRVKILGLLSQYKGNADVLTHVTAALSDYNPDIRLAALKALDQMDAYSAATAITGLLKDSEGPVRQEALNTLNDLQNKRQKEIDAACAEWKKEMQERQAQAAQNGNPLAAPPPAPEECAAPKLNPW